MTDTRKTAEEMQQMPYVKWCILEAIRLRAPGAITRRVVRTLRIQNYIIPPGDLLMVSLYWAHRKPQYFPEPEEFKPEQWEKAELVKDVLEVLVAFGGGRNHWNARLIHEEQLGGRDNAEDTPVGRIHTAHTAMKGDHLFSNLRKATFYQRVYLLGGEELLVVQSTVGVSTLGDSFHQITDFNDLPTSLFACNVDQSVFEEQDGKPFSSFIWSADGYYVSLAVLVPHTVLINHRYPGSAYQAFYVIQFPAKGQIKSSHSDEGWSSTVL
ncbi:hypothetical protein J4Q44_G00344900 [Coregonus suidteri]|uniref:Uncharacterized protein n=1 Tax=Coregonus suidteri TaxID=861788 RepID=A0AAN8Q8G6_9TELE